MSTDATGRNGPRPAPQKGQFGQIKPYLAPILITFILVLGNSQYGMLEGHDDSALVSGTALAILAAILAELVLSRLATRRWPHLASCYITGISVGILLRTALLWPYALCSLLSISSKYALRIKGRHLWNPSNLGVSVLLFVIPAAVAPLSQQWGNKIWVPLIIIGLGSLILFALGRLHITLTYVAAFVVLSGVRSVLQDKRWETELGLLTAPSYLLFMFFMITDPKTTTRTRGRRCAVAVLVAVVETGMRLDEVIHAPYYALFYTAPVTNLLEIWWDGRHAPKVAPAVVATVSATPPTSDGDSAAATPDVRTVAGPSSK